MVLTEFIQTGIVPMKLEEKRGTRKLLGAFLGTDSFSSDLKCICIQIVIKSVW